MIKVLSLFNKDHLYLANQFCNLYNGKYYCESFVSEEI